jgi:glutamate synthase (NADPH/NADH) small chain
VGHRVTVYERADRIGGLLRYGIPDFKMEKRVLDRRLDLMQQEGIRFEAGTNVGVDVKPEDLDKFDAVVICAGATIPRDLPVPGRLLNGVHFAMDFLTCQNRWTAGDDPESMGLPPISAEGKHVIVIGGGDTGSDCIGTSIRQNARSVTNFELFPKPSEDRTDDQPWPFWPVKLRTSSSHEEGCKRQWGILTKEFIGDGERIARLKTVDLEFVIDGRGHTEMREIADSVREWQADLVLLAMGFTGPDPDTIVKGYNLKLDDRGNILTNRDYMSSVKGVFAAGDANRGQSLIVWAISEGREAARCVDTYLMGTSLLPTKGGVDLPRI